METSPEQITKRERQSISLREKQLILKLHGEMLAQNPDIAICDIMQHVANTMEVSMASVGKIVREFRDTNSLASPKTTKFRVKIEDSIDDRDLSVIRKKVHKFFFRNEIPTINKILKVVNEDEQLPDFKRTTFYKIFKKMDFKYAARSRNSLLLERDEIIVWRRQYLKKIKKYREEGRELFYTDETWVNAGHTKSKVWMDPNVHSSKQALLQGLSTGLKN